MEDARRNTSSPELLEAKLSGWGVPTLSMQGRLSTAGSVVEVRVEPVRWIIGLSTKAAIIWSGNIGTDLLIKIRRWSGNSEVVALLGIDSESVGLARAASGYPTASRKSLRRDVLEPLGVIVVTA